MFARFDQAFTGVANWIAKAAGQPLGFVLAFETTVIWGITDRCLPNGARESFIGIEHRTAREVEAVGQSRERSHRRQGRGGRAQS